MLKGYLINLYAIKGIRNPHTIKGYFINLSAIKGTLCTGTPRCRRTTPGRTSTGRCTRRWSERRWSSARTSRRCWRDTASRNVPFGGSSSHSWVNIETFVQSLLLHNGGFCNGCITKQWLHLALLNSDIMISFHISAVMKNDSNAIFLQILFVKFCNTWFCYEDKAY